MYHTQVTQLDKYSYIVRTVYTKRNETATKIKWDKETTIIKKEDNYDTTGTQTN